MAKLCPSQQKAFDYLMEALPIGKIFVVWSHQGMGRTTLLQELHRQKGGEFLTMKHYIDQLRGMNPFQMEEVLEDLLMKSLNRNEMVILDDLNLIYGVVCGCGFGDAYPRSKFVEAILTSIATSVSYSKNTLVLGIEGKISPPIWDRCYCANIRKYEAEDYKFLCETFLEKKAAALDFQKIYRFAPKLNAHQLKGACLWLKETDDLNTDKFIDYMRSQRMGSNVDLAEVEAVDLYTLRGVDDVLEALEANIIVPLERDDIAAEFDIQPKRGVLLAGPPGTGKTTIGRALAHRLRSKFFLVDGTFISGTREFYGKIQQVFEAAKNNAPSIIFIDDSDVIFENKDDFGLYRYLLTMLDGLESESNKRVCIMMTTMDVGAIPPALVRSGRIELWLETKLPDREARLAILSDQTHKLPAQMRSFDAAKLADETEELTGADLRRLVEDAKVLYAFDRSRNLESPIQIYFEKSTVTIRSNKEKYAESEIRNRSRGPSLPKALAAAMSSFGSYAPSDDDDFPG